MTVPVLGDWLARWRVAVGVSQRELARQADISQSGISRVEHGFQVVGARRLERLIVALDRLGAESVRGPIAPPPVRHRAGGPVPNGGVGDPAWGAGEEPPPPP